MLFCSSSLTSGAFCGGGSPKTLVPFSQGAVFVTDGVQIEGGCAWSLNLDGNKDHSFNVVLGWNVSRGVWKAGAVESCNAKDGPGTAESATTSFQSSNRYKGYRESSSTPVIFYFTVEVDMSNAFYPLVTVQELLDE